MEKFTRIRQADVQRRRDSHLPNGTQDSPEATTDTYLLHLDITRYEYPTTQHDSEVEK
jgi:hypothetical protein